MSGHDRFEVLAGAVILGEASDAERAQFAAHAASCPACGPAGADAARVRAAVERARGAETWRPAIGGLVARRIRESGNSRFRSTVGALGAAVALSLALNVVFAGGLSSRLLGSFAPPPETGGSGASTMRIGLESPVPHGRATVTHAAVRVPAPSVNRGAARARLAALRVPAATLAAKRPPPASAANDAAAEIPDVLAGLDLDGSGGGNSKHVAFRPQPVCAGAARSEATLPEAQSPAQPDPSEPCTAPTPRSSQGIVRAEGVGDRRPHSQQGDRPDEHDDDSR